ncbi:MAG: alpha-amylase family glycosyl hydrolase [Anaerolineales bacterium]|nr:alpha-amylase family glycosyl hydrolase [Anaerolineales bacterium]
MNEFIFGELASWEYRARLLTEKRRGVSHRSKLDPYCPTPADEPVLTVRVELDSPVERVICTVLEPAEGEVELERVATEWDLLNWTYFHHWQCRLPAQPEGTLVRYKIHAYPEMEGTVVPADEDIYFSYLVGSPAPPEWSKEAIVYQIFPDRFHPGQDRAWNQVSRPDEIYGGTLRGIIERLDYIADLGFNCLWLNPIFPDSTHHGYHATDYFSINPRLGTMDDLHELVAGAHDRGIRMVLDFVANHWGRDHATFLDAQADQNSPYFDWYHWIEWPEKYEAYFGIPALPKLNVNNRELRTHLHEAAEFWLLEGNFDGLRLDHAQGVTLDFWTEFRKEVKAMKPDTWMFGEVTDSPARQIDFSGRLDGCLDFMLNQALRDVFAFETLSLSRFNTFLDNHTAFFPADFSRPAFLDNHDMDRFLHIGRNDPRKVKLAALCLFTLSGPPIVYYGTEVGVRQEHSVKGPGSRGLPEARQAMVWGEEQDHDLHGFFRRLIHLRRDHPVLVSGVRKTVHLDDRLGTLAYTRSSGTDQALVLINRSAETRKIMVGGHSYDLPPCSGDVHISSTV